MIDQIDRRILALLQRDVTISMEQLAQEVHLSKNACWRRVRALDERGVIAQKVAILDAKALDLGQCVFVAVRVKEHSIDWLRKFNAAVASFEEITGAYRTSGEVDYILKVQVRDVEGYDAFYKDLIKQVPGMDISATFVMEEIKTTTALPV